MRSTKLFIAITVFLTIFLIHCSLNQYSHQTSLKIYTKFPGKRSPSQTSLNKPTGAADSYVPAFIDRIILTITGTSTDGETVDVTMTKLSSDGNFSAEFDPPDLPFSNNLTINSKAYTCRKTDLSCCEPEDEACTDEKWILTHEATAEDVTINGDIDQSEIKIILTVKTQPDSSFPGEVIHGVDLDQNTNLDLNNFIEIQTISQDSLNKLTSFYHALGVSSSGTIAFCWFDTEQYIVNFSVVKDIYLKLSFFDYNGNFLSEPTLPFLTNEIKNIPEIINENILFKNDILYIPFAKSDNSIQVAVFEPPYTSVTGLLTVLEPTDITVNSPCIKEFREGFIISWNESEKKIAKFRIFDQDFNPASNDEIFCSVTESGETCKSPKIFIYDQIHIIAFTYKNTNNNPHRIVGTLYEITGPDSSDQYSFSFLGEKTINTEAESVFGGNDSVDFDFDFDVFAVYENTETTYSSIKGTSISLNAFQNENGELPLTLFPVIGHDPGDNPFNNMQPIQLNSRKDVFITLYSSDDPFYSSEGFKILYKTADNTFGRYPAFSSGNSPNDDTWEKLNMGSPRAVFNEDGFGVISWFSNDHKIRFKRWLF